MAPPHHHHNRNKKPSSPFSSSTSSSTSSSLLLPKTRSTTSFNGASKSRSDSMYSQNRSPVAFPSPEELIGDPVSGGGDAISVTIRFRPLSEREYQRGDEISWYADGDSLVRNEYNPVTAYAFDRVFGPSAVTQEVYEVAGRPVVKSAMEGVLGTVFAYGVTSSGKTHTMHGDHLSPGIIPLAIKDVFSIIQDTPGREFLLRVSYLEIYNEVINDLLDPTGQNLRVREDAQGTYVEGIKEEVVLSPGHALSFVAAGEEHRHVGSNNFNLLSSRSHTIFTLMIESSAHESSKTETTGLRRKEGSYINKSLLTLGTVIGKLSEGKASHVPYRDSKLTRLLQSSLSGHGHVSLICTITPASSNMEETHNTLKFASRAKRVEIYASRNKIIDEKSLIKKYQREISVLKQELDQLRRGMLVGVNPDEIMTLKQKLEEGQVKMQSRLEEEEEAKAALMSRIQRLTKLILVSSKNTIPGLTDISSHQRSLSANEDDDGSLLLQSENLNDSPSDISYERKHRRNSSNLSAAGSTITELTQAGDLINGSAVGAKLLTGTISIDQMDLLVEQVKMLAGEIAFSSSTMKRLIEQSANDPEISKTQSERYGGEPPLAIHAWLLYMARHYTAIAHRKAYEKCNNIPQESRALIDTFLKDESDKDYELNLSIAVSGCSVDIKNFLNNGKLDQVVTMRNVVKVFFLRLRFQKVAAVNALLPTAMDKKTNQSMTPEKPPMPPISSFLTGGSSSQQHTHQPMSHISSNPTVKESAEEHDIGDEYLTELYLTEKEQQQLLLDEEALRETL
nr:kinesin-like protein KIN-7D, mitochondrial [Tanacetum cinerariifolium]